jgi:D-glycero-alpha-D-manno-heptose-7-phosphate kinase
MPGSPSFAVPLPVRATAPNRVDVAGGTLDIFPLYLIVPGSMTVNAAIGVNSLVEIRPSGGRTRLYSADFRRAVHAADTRGFSTAGRLGLIAAVLKCYPAVEGIELRFRNEAPVGSGIGASSALLVAAMLAMDALLGRKRGWDEVSRTAMEIEAGHLKCLTGRQDHVAALRGGILGLTFRPGRVEAARLGAGSAAGRAFAAHGFLAGTGVAHHSGSVNWRMVRGAIGGDEGVLRKFRAIAGTARDAWEALREGEIAAAGRAVAREWATRRTLAAGVSPPNVERLFASREFRFRVAGAKLCGAGGGGTVFGLLRDPGDRRRVEEHLERQGFSVIPFRLANGARVLTGAEASAETPPV